MHCKKKLLIFLILLLGHFSYCYEYNSINTNKAYLRVGPGKWYPIKWEFRAPGLPVRALQENGDYKMVELFDGTQGWIATSLISDKKKLLVLEDALIYSKRKKPLVKVKKFVVLDSLGCANKIIEQHCEIRIKKIRGYIHKDKIWGNN